MMVWFKWFSFSSGPVFSGEPCYSVCACCGQNLFSENFLGVNLEYGFAALPTKILVDSAFIMGNWSTKTSGQISPSFPPYYLISIFFRWFSMIFPMQIPPKKGLKRWIFRGPLSKALRLSGVKGWVERIFQPPNGSGRDGNMELIDSSRVRSASSWKTQAVAVNVHPLYIPLKPAV